MSQTLEKSRIRLLFDAGSHSRAKDALTGNDPEAWKLNDLAIEIGAFLGLKNGDVVDGSQIDVSPWESATLEIKAASSGSTNLMAATTAVFDNTVTAETWTDLTKQHAVFEFTNAETNIAAGTYDGVVTVLRTDGSRITLGIFKFTVVDSRATIDADDPAENPGAAISLSEADARYQNLPRFSVHKNGSSQVCAADSGTVLTWSDEEYDIGGHFAGNQLTGVVGAYRLSGAVALNGTPEQVIINVLKNGSAYKTGNYLGAGIVGLVVLPFSVDVVANDEADYFEIEVRNLHPTNDVTVDGTIQTTYWQGAIIP